MALFVLADTHLSWSTHKPMDIFGDRWKNHTEKLAENWCAVVGENDTVVIPGDISWGMTAEEALPDLRFLHDLPGKKIISKGNHDYWWQTTAKLNALFAANGLDSLSILHNNAYLAEGFRICGTRGWFTESAAPGGADYRKLVAREAGRLRLSLETHADFPGETLVFLHFPPVWMPGNYVCREILDVLHQNGIKRCFFGHMHGQYNLPGTVSFEEIDFTLVSADYLSFLPYKIG